jgi:demethylmenaquinone methyltransferase/2-methoxy-6-polyprenyl-1,4-benzoquinol methylase
MVRELQNHGCHVTGVDLSEEMLIIAESKVPTATYMIADAEHLPFENDCFDVVTCAFGVRNFVHLEQGLSEMLRVLKPGGRMVILELATPDSRLIRPFYNLYAKHIIPWLGSRIAGNREAYTYLPDSIARFPKGEAFLSVLGDSVAENAGERKFTFGVCRMYVINKEAAR